MSSMDGEIWREIRELKDRVRALEQRAGIGGDKAMGLQAVPLLPSAAQIDFIVNADTIVTVDRDGRAISVDVRTKKDA